MISGIRKMVVDDLLAGIITNRNGEEEYKDRMIDVELDIRDEQALQQAIELVVSKWDKIDVLDHFRIEGYQFGNSSNMLNC
jgi:hypothetical protein